MKKALSRRTRRLLILAGWLLVWQGISLLTDNSILMAGPLETAAALAGRLGQPEFFRSVYRSVLGIGSGFLGGLAAGLALAAGSRRFPLLEEILAPPMQFIKAVPVASFVVVLLIWWGSGNLSTSISFLVVLPNIYVNTLEGLKSTDRELLEVAKVFRVPFFNRFFYIYRPAMKPFLDSGLKIALGMSWKSGVAAEVIGTPDFTIGERLYFSKISLDTAGVFAWTAVVIFISFLLERLALRLWRGFLAWEPACRAPRETQEPGGGLWKAGEPERRMLGAGEPELRQLREAGPEGRRPELESPGGRLSGERTHRLAFRGVTKKYRGISVMENVSAEYWAGKVYFFTGPSGSGKTTAFRLLAGLERPDGGLVEADAPVSMVFQENRLCGGYSAVRNVELVTGDASAAREELLRLLPEECLEGPCERLSGGQKRRVALVRAMAAASSAVLLDEPFTGMDGGTRDRSVEYILERQRGRAVLIATHSGEDAARFGRPGTVGGLDAGGSPRNRNL